MGLLTDCQSIVDFEAAEHLVNVSGMEKTVSSHNHLERLWLHDTHWNYYISDTFQTNLILNMLNMKLIFIFKMTQIHYTQGLYLNCFLTIIQFIHLFALCQPRETAPPYIWKYEPQSSNLRSAVWFIRSEKMRYHLQKTRLKCDPKGLKAENNWIQ